MSRTLSTSSLCRALALGTTALVCGCASTAPQPLYQWGSYQAQVYAYMKGDGSPAEQYSALQKDLNEAQSKGRRLPPGFLAHMALLEMKLGQDDLAVTHLEQEKALYPESTGYVDWLLKQKHAPGKS